MKALQHIGFDVLEKNDEEVILKRVLSPKNGKRRHNIESSLPKLSIQYFSTDELEQLQEIAYELTKHLVARRQKGSLRLKIYSFLRLK